MRHVRPLLGLSLALGLAACAQNPAAPPAPVLLSGPSQPSTASVQVVPGELIVKLRTGVSLEALAAQSGLGLQPVRSLSGGEILARVTGDLQA